MPLRLPQQSPKQEDIYDISFSNRRDLDRLVAMSDQAKESFKAKNIDQWQKGGPTAR